MNYLLSNEFLMCLKVCASPQAKTFFVKACTDEQLQPLELIKCVRTWWGLIHDLINRVIECKAVCSLLIDALYTYSHVFFSRPCNDSAGQQMNLYHH